MLILSRKTGESLFLGEKVEVTVLDVSGDKVKIGITAPSDIRIIRRELIETEKANLEAAFTRPDTVAGRFPEIKKIKIG